MRLRIRTKLVAAVVVGLLLVAVTAGFLMRFVYERGAQVAAEASVRNAAAAFANLEKTESDKLAVGLVALAADEQLQRAFVARDRERLLALATPIFRELRERHHVTHWYFHLPERVVFLRVHAPELAGDAVARETLRRAAETGELATGKDLGQTAFALRAVLPWRAGGRLIGYLELGEEIEDFLSTMKAQTGDDYAMFVEKAHLDGPTWARTRARAGERNGWDDHPDVVCVEETAPLAWPGGRRLLNELPDAGEVIPAQREDRVLGLFATRDATGHAVGGVLVSHDTSALRAGVAELRGRVLLTIVLLTGALAALVVVLLDVLVFDRVRKMSELFDDLPARMARGDYRIEEEVEPPPDDELGRFERLFHRAVEVIGGALRDIERERTRDRARDR